MPIPSYVKSFHCPSLSLSIHPSVHRSLCPFFPPTFDSDYLPLCQSLPMSIHPSVHPCLCPCLSLSKYQCCNEQHLMLNDIFNFVLHHLLLNKWPFCILLKSSGARAPVPQLPQSLIRVSMLIISVLKVTKKCLKLFLEDITF
jgi:hypothetical protein